MFLIGKKNGRFHIFAEIMNNIEDTAEMPESFCGLAFEHFMVIDDDSEIIFIEIPLENRDKINEVRICPTCSEIHGERSFLEEMKDIEGVNKMDVLQELNNLEKDSHKSLSAKWKIIKEYFLSMEFEPEKFKKWLLEENKALNGGLPIIVLKTPDGVCRVAEMVLDIEMGAGGG